MKMLKYFAKSEGVKRRSLDINSVELGLRKIESKAKCVRFSVPFEPPRKQGGGMMKEIKCLQRATKKDFLFTGSFYEAIGPVLVMAQCFALMPVVGIRGDSPADLRFSWKAFRSIYAIIAFVLTVIYAVLSIVLAFRNKINIDSVAPMVLFTSVVYGMVCFFFLAMKWPELMVEWAKIENSLPKLRSQFDKRRLSNQVRMVTIVMMILSLSEHMLSIISILHYSIQCPSQHKDPIKEFFRAQLNQFFEFTEYAPWKAFLGKCLNVISTFVWSYTDLFVMVMSVGVSNRFKLFNEGLMRVKYKHMPTEFWSTRRQQYRSLCALTEMVDLAISQITVVSFSNNLFFICITLLRSLKPKASFAHAFYFWFSLSFLLGRTMALCLYAAEIYDQSKVPVTVLRAAPNESWCLDIQRFSEEVVNNTVALSGMRFFHLTRGLILSVAGTIATYELVLIQFNADDKLPEIIC